jgi:hypothetical protein
LTAPLDAARGFSQAEWRRLRGHRRCPGGLQLQHVGGAAAARRSSRRCYRWLAYPKISTAT